MCSLCFLGLAGGFGEGNLPTTVRSRGLLSYIRHCFVDRRNMGSRAAALLPRNARCNNQRPALREFLNRLLGLSARQGAEEKALAILVPNQRVFGE
jgi:hypothetical protein